MAGKSSSQPRLVHHWGLGRLWKGGLASGSDFFTMGILCAMLLETQTSTFLRCWDTVCASGLCACTWSLCIHIGHPFSECPALCIPQARMLHPCTLPPCLDHHRAPTAVLSCHRPFPRSQQEQMQLAPALASRSRLWPMPRPQSWTPLA